MICFRINFLRLYNTPLYVHTTFSLSTHLLMDMYLISTFWLSYNVAIRMTVQISPWDPAFHSFGYIARRGIAGSCVNFIFSLFRNWGTVFCIGCTILRSHYRSKRFPVSPHPLQHNFIFCFMFNSRYPNGCEVVFHCVFV